MTEIDSVNTNTHLQAHIFRLVGPQEPTSVEPPLPPQLTVMISLTATAQDIAPFSPSSSILFAVWPSPREAQH